MQHSTAVSRQPQSAFEQLTLFDAEPYRVRQRRAAQPPSQPAPITQQPITPAGYLSPEKLAELFDISIGTVRRRAQRGTWPSTHVGRLLRFSPADVAAIQEKLEDGL